MQRMVVYIEDRVEQFLLPDQEEEIFPGVPWGHMDAFFTPAFWAARAWIHEVHGEDWTFTHYKTGTTFKEEVAACLLGGHGITAEMALAAFKHLQGKRLLDGTPSVEEVAEALREPLQDEGRTIHYRFPNRRARFIAEALVRLDRADTVPSGGRALRDWLMEFPGIGPKTASWIVRNWFDADDVAIIDIHVQRACTLAKVFPKELTPARHYFRLEQRFLEFASAIHTKASTLDNLVWNYMRSIGHLAVAS